MRSVQTDIVDQAWTTLQKTGMILDRNILVASLIRELYDSLLLFEKEGIQPFLLRWKKYDDFLNRSVRLVNGNREIYGIARGINTYGALMLDRNGTITSCVGEEISLNLNE